MTLFRRIAAIQRPWLAMLLLLALMAGTYSWSLGTAPPYLSIEEVGAARASLILAQTGRDQLGRRLPLFVGEPGYPAGYDPLWVYANAALVRLAPFSEALIRLPSIVAALASTALLFVAARHGIGGPRVAWGAAGALALTPVFFIYSRIGSQPVATIPFVTLWLTCLALHLRTGRRRFIAGAGLALGLGCYAYLAGMMQFGLYFALTAAVIALYPPRRRWPALMWLTIGFAAALSPMMAWHVAHPERIAQLSGYYSDHGYTASITAARPGGLDFLLGRLDLWWHAFNPERLLFVGDSDYRFSTRTIGYLSVPLGILVLIGMSTLSRVPDAMRWIIIGGIVLAPVTTVLSGETTIKRWLASLPFFALLAAIGFDRLWTAHGRGSRLIAITLALGCGVSFAGFLRQYHGDYIVESAYTYGFNRKGAIAALMAAAETGACAFVDKRVELTAEWMLYTRALSQAPWPRTPRVVDVESPTFSFPPECTRAGAIILTERLREEPQLVARIEARGWRVERIPEVRGEDTGYAVIAVTSP